MKRSIRNRCAVILALAVLAPAPAEPQSSNFLNTMGCGSALAGVVSTLDDPGLYGGTAVAAGLVGGALGIVVGYNLSSSANRTLAEGRSLNRLHLAAVTAGAVLGGGGVGTIAGFVISRARGRSPLSGDGEDVILPTIAGTIVGVVVVRRNWDRLTSRGLEVLPVVLGGRVGVAARVRF